VGPPPDAGAIHFGWVAISACPATRVVRAAEVGPA
jgi:hypothetical protein